MLLDGDLADATSEQMIKAVDQAVKQAGEMLEVALGWNSSGADQGRSLTWMPRAGDSAKMLEAAQQDPKRPAKDLSAMMRDRSFGSYTTANSPDDALDTSRSVSIAPEKPTPPALNVGDLKTTPGRKIGPQGMSSGWIFIDSWYLIGPFPNLGREHMNTRFPPESLVDLDATYVGKDGRVVGWEFYQSAKAETTPPGQEEYAIYYAYTQFYVDQAMDLWISMGADDFAKVWIEDHLVWVSGRHEKAWQVNEGLRKVYFKKGPNRILVRIENGWRGMGFSILVSTEAD